MAENNNEIFEDFVKSFSEETEVAVAEPVVPVAVETPIPVAEEVATEVDEDLDRFTIIESTTDDVQSSAPVTPEPVRESEPLREERREQVPQVQAEPEFANEDSKRLFEMLKAGKLEEVKDMLNASLADYSKLAPIDKIKAQLRKQSPDLDENDLNEYIQDKYHLYGEEHQDYDDKASRKGRVALKMDASQAQAFLEGTKKPLSIPEQFKTAQGSVNNEEVISSYLKGEEAKMVESQKAASITWQQTVDKELSVIPPMRFKLSDNTEVEYNLSETEKNQLKTNLRSANISSIFNELGWVDKDGKENLLKLAHDMYLVKNKDTIIRAATKQQAVAEKLKMVKTLNNVNLERTSPTGTQSTDEEEASRMEDMFLNNKR